MVSLHTIFYAVSSFVTDYMCRVEYMKLTRKQCDGVSFSSGSMSKKASSKYMFDDPNYMSTSSWDKHRRLVHGRRRVGQEDKELGGGRDVAATKTTIADHFGDALAESIEEFIREATSTKKRGRVGEGDSATWGRRRRRRAPTKTRRRRWGLLTKVGGWVKKKINSARAHAKKVDGWVKKKINGAKKFFVKGGKRLLSKIVVKFLLNLTGWDRKTYNCMWHLATHAHHTTQR
jgi:hypothetical protein